MTNDIERVLLTKEEIAGRVRQLGAEITCDYAGKAPRLVGILKGSAVFMADLMREIALPASIDFLAVSSYGVKSQSTGAVRILKDLDMTVEGEDLLIVEDILDSGLTLSYIINLLAGSKPSSVRLCTLLDKPGRRRVDVSPHYTGFTVPDEFLVGYGLDYAERYRNLPYIAVLKRRVYET
jgi:hypoxanthine phosphoribosyltransferase